MKKRNLIKLFALTLCFITILSTVAFAKESSNMKFTSVSEYGMDPHPPTTEIPE